MRVCERLIGPTIISYWHARLSRALRNSVYGSCSRKISLIQIKNILPSKSMWIYLFFRDFVFFFCFISWTCHNFIINSCTRSIANPGSIVSYEILAYILTRISYGKADLLRTRARIMRKTTFSLNIKPTRHQVVLVEWNFVRESLNARYAAWETFPSIMISLHYFVIPSSTEFPTRAN